jgi:hypothetical protein
MDVQARVVGAAGNTVLGIGACRVVAQAADAPLTSSQPGRSRAAPNAVSRRQTSTSARVLVLLTRAEPAEPGSRSSDRLVAARGRHRTNAPSPR